MKRSALLLILLSAVTTLWAANCISDCMRYCWSGGGSVHDPATCNDIGAGGRKCSLQVSQCSR